MEELTNWSQLFIESLRAFGQAFKAAIPGIIGAILILLLGWLFAKLVSGGIGRLLKVIKFDKLAERIKAGPLLEKANIRLAPSALVGKFVYWILMLLVITTAADTLGWSAVSGEISKLVNYLPSLLSAIVFFMVGVYIATFAREVIHGATKTLGISSGRTIGNLVFYLLFLLVSLTALGQAGVDTTLISSNLLLIIGSIMTAAAISYGIASKDVLANILASFFSRKIFLKGQMIEIDGQRGEIIEVSNIAVILKLNEDEELVVPTHQLIINKVKIIKK
ncbi:MAG: mechanosensitive ion channel [Saprospiraceae bacterium]